ncbi:MAG: hypothetical protein AKCLJLPJ_01972 [Fimbriimonadales bacterium]|nr:MAG: hypothetical protein EDM73_09925 [Armatimonadota bacterium]MBV6503878.1 hypothetical protein [Fimbriimonadales bacterium]MCE7899581.1 hypothetical protein [Armatimonadetes bacterium ATM1]MDL1927669.1 hypothetical protein [Fimbriimonadia bacterium ATM]MBC6970635.1 hypothetical protein [Armatimonadota bacterium]
MIEFYDVKSRSKVKVPEANIVKKKTTRKTKSGATQTRYQFVAEYNGMKLFKFINEETFNKATDIKEGK